MLANARRNRGGGLWWAFLLFFSGLLLWGLFWGIPGISDTLTNVPLALAIAAGGSMGFPSALLYTYIVMGWACVAIAITGLVVLLGPRGARREFRRGVGKARHTYRAYQTRARHVRRFAP